MEPHRRYAEEPDPRTEPSWYAAQRSPETSGSFSAPTPYESGVHERPSGAFRLPSQQPAVDPYASPAGNHAAPTPPLESFDAGQMRVPDYAPPRRTETAASESVYNARRPVLAVVFAVVTVVLLVPAILLLFQATFVDDPSARGVVPAVLLMLGLPLTGTGLYTLASGGPVSARDAWLRPPLAYLPIGLLLLIAAGLSVA